MTSWRAMRFDQDVELVWTGKLMVKISYGGPVAARRTICSNFTWSGRNTRGAVVGPAGPLVVIVLAAGDHLQRDRFHVIPTYSIMIIISQKHTLLAWITILHTIQFLNSSQTPIMNSLYSLRSRDLT